MHRPALRQRAEIVLSSGFTERVCASVVALSSGLVGRRWGRSPGRLDTKSSPMRRNRIRRRARFGCFSLMCRKLYKLRVGQEIKQHLDGKARIILASERTELSPLAPL